MTGYPAWMTLAFAVGVFGGLAGSVLLLMRRRAAMPVLRALLVAYVGLWVGDALHGVFAAMGAPQVGILTLVVAIAAALVAPTPPPRCACATGRGWSRTGPLPTPRNSSAAIS